MAQTTFVPGTTITSEFLNGIQQSEHITFTPAGTGATDVSVQSKLREFVSVADFMSAQDLVDIANGTQSSSVRAAVKAAVDHINTVGGTLYFPPGHYNSPYLTHLTESNWIEITKSGVSLVAAPGSVTLENFLFYVRGQYGTSQIVGASGFTSGDTQINTAAAHGLAVGDFVQLLSSVNAGSVDAGDFQMESTNPTTLETGKLRLSEIHRVAVVDSATTVTLFGSVLYPTYKDNMTGYADPLPGITGAEVRKLTMVEGVKFKGLNFKNTGSSSFREILARAAADLRFEDCGFEAGTLSGSHFKSTDCIGVYFVRCKSRRNPVGASGSSWNSFLPGGGTCDVWFIDSRFEGEWQNIDATPNVYTSDPGAADANDANSIQRSVQNLTVKGCTFVDCTNGVTTHPGVYGFTATGNKAFNCSTPIGARGLKNVIVGNLLEGLNAGIEISAFYNDTLVADNEIYDTAQSSVWSGIALTPMSSETMNRNNVKNVVIKDNTIACKYSTSPTRRGIQIRHYGNGVPVAGFTEFTDPIKVALSDYAVEGNKLVNCCFYQGRYINGVSFKGNTLGGNLGGLVSYCEVSFSSAAGHFDGNVFLDSASAAFDVGAVDGVLVYAFEKRHMMGRNHAKEAVSSTFAASSTLGDYSITPGLSTAQEGGAIASGVYTPTLTNSTNVAASTAYECIFTRVGGVVHVCGQVRIDPTTTGDTLLFMSLPIASNLASTTDAAGAFNAALATDGGAITANTGGDTLQFRYVAAATAATIFNFSACYRVL